MYGWLWAHLPGGRWAKAACSVLLALGAVTVLFLWVFPWVEENVPLLSSVTVSDEETPATPSPAPSPSPSSTTGAP